MGKWVGAGDAPANRGGWISSMRLSPSASEKSVFLPRSPAGLLQPAGGASGCRRRVTRHPAGHSCHCFRCAGGAPSSQATRQGALQRASVVAGSSCTSRSRRPGIQSQAWAGSPAIAVGFASVAQAGAGACRDCGGIEIVKERGSVAWPAVLCWRWMNYASAHMHVNALMQFFMRTDMHERKSPRLGGLQEGREGLVVELAK